MLVLMSSSFESLLPGIQKAMAEVGSFQISEWRKRDPGWGEAKSAKDFVSFVDRDSEARLADALRKILPEAGFYGEETIKERGPELTWVVDPLDGTTNYLSGLDQFSVSVALFKGDEPVLGCVYKPAGGEWWWAWAGGGAYYGKTAAPDPCGHAAFPAGGQGTRLEIQRSSSLSNALVGTGTPFRSPDTRPAFFAASGQVLIVARDIRRLGSAALDLAFLASGWLQAFWEVDLEPYDVGAGILLLKETGCVFTSFSGEVYNPFKKRSLAAGRPGAAEELRRIIAPCYGTIRE